MIVTNLLPTRYHPRLLNKQAKWKLVTLAVIVLTFAFTAAASILIGTTDKGIWVIIGSLALLGTLAVILRPSIGVYLLVAFVYLNLSDSFKASFGIPSLIQPLTALMVVSVFANNIVIQRKGLVFRKTELAILVYGLVFLVSSFWATDQAAAQGDFGDWVKNFLIVLMIVQISDNEIVWKRMQWIMILCAAFLALLSCYQIATGNYDNTFFGLAKAPLNQITNGFDRNRVSGPLDDPNFYAQVLMMTLPIAVHRMLTETSKFRRIVGGICSALILTIVVLTYSRGAFLALTVISILILRKRRINFAKVAIIVALVLVLITPILPAGYLDRVFTLDSLLSADASNQTDVSFKGRFSEAIAAGQMFLDNPLLGVGSSNYPVHYLEYSYRLGLDDRVEMRQAHNFYLQTAAEKGIVGLVVLFILIVAVFASIRRAKRQLISIHRYDLIPWVSGVQLGLISYLLTSIFLHDDYSRYFWLIVSFAAAASVMSEALVRQYDRQREAAEESGFVIDPVLLPAEP